MVSCALELLIWTGLPLLDVFFSYLPRLSIPVVSRRVLLTDLASYTHIHPSLLKYPCLSLFALLADILSYLRFFGAVWSGRVYS